MREADDKLTNLCSKERIPALKSGFHPMEECSATEENNPAGYISRVDSDALGLLVSRCGRGWSLWRIQDEREGLHAPESHCQRKKHYTTGQIASRGAKCQGGSIILFFCFRLFFAFRVPKGAGQSFAAGCPQIECPKLN